MCSIFYSPIDLNLEAGDTKQFSVANIISHTDFAAHFGFGLDLLLAVLRVTAFDSSLTLRFATQVWHLAVPCSRFSIVLASLSSPQPGHGSCNGQPRALTFLWRCLSRATLLCGLTHSWHFQVPLIFSLSARTTFVQPLHAKLLYERLPFS